ncbi:MAG: hypothetical protein ISS15_19380 [Alphaproteobacteria bacterium]|nr:hypothetical protein [Alphaproteobacteria bacterium]MBL7099825.1 hypothetical protein [Alphaproteobacteria bacterium]
MHKVSVGSSIGHAYEFFLQNLTNVIGTAWLPALIYAVGFFLFFQHMHDWMPIERQDLAAVVLTAFTFIGAWAFTLVIHAVIGISLTQEALGVRKDFTLAHFVIGPRELRLFFAYVRFYFVALLLYVAFAAVSVGAMYVAQHYGSGLAPKIKLGEFSPAVVAAALLTIVLFVWYLLAMLRLFFLLAAVASAEHHARLSHAWSLTRGSELRILVVYIGTFLPLAIAAVVGLYFLIGPDQWAHAIAAMQAQKAGAPPALAPFYAEHAFVFAAAVGVLSLLGSALLAGASAHAYRVTSGHERAEREDDAGQVDAALEPETVAAVPVVAPVAEELPAAVHHEHHDSHGLTEEAPHHGDNHHSGNGHNSDHAAHDGGHGDHAVHARDGHHEDAPVELSAADEDHHAEHGNGHHATESHEGHGDGAQASNGDHGEGGHDHHNNNHDDHHRHDDREAA